MQLEHARIKNFRSLRNVEIEFGAHTALIGGNGAGKSSILKALEKFYSTTPKCEPDDYFGRDQSIPIEIELTFKDLNEHESAEFDGRVRDGRLIVTRIFDSSQNSGRYHGVALQNADFVGIRSQTAATPKRNAYNALRETPAYADLPAAPSATAVDQAMSQWEADHPARLTPMRDDGQFFGFQNNSRGKLQRYTSFVFIPAVRDASADAVDGKSSLIGRLLELLVRSKILQRQDIQQFRQEMSERYQQLVTPQNMPELGNLAGTLTASLQGLYRDAEVELSWRESGDLPVPLPMADVIVKDDGFGAPVDRQGHGLQRAFIITLLQHLARTAVPDQEPGEQERGGGAAAQPIAPTLILAIEEPELYQHPTKQRHFAEVLRDLSTGALPGVQGHTQIIFGSHSPMFVSMGKADEVRLVRRTSCDDSDYKQCVLQALDLSRVATTLEQGWAKPPRTFTAQTLGPRLHILGTELSEGFFANGVVLVEGRSDKAALAATCRLLNVNFEAAGIAILSAEGKGNLDKPLVIFRELGIPTFVLWDCDSHKPSADCKPAMNLALLKLADSTGARTVAPVTTAIGASYGHFAETLECTLIDELSREVYQSCLNAAREHYGVQANDDAQKIPDLMLMMLRSAKELGHESKTLQGLIRAIWRHVFNTEIADAPAESATTVVDLGLR